MITRFLVRDNKGFFLSKQATDNNGVACWATEKELTLTFDELQGAKAAVRLLPGSPSLYKIEPLISPGNSGRKYSFSIEWQHRESFASARIIPNLTEMEMINKIFEEARDFNLPLISASAVVTTPRLREQFEKSL